MTHFTVGIIVPQDKLPQIQSFICHQMRPYDHSITVEPYVCYSLDMAQAEIDRDICLMEQVVAHQDPNYRLDNCRERLARLRLTTPEDRYREYAQTHEHFNAQGEPLSTYNPDSKWDWWVVGGRWNGWITGNKSESRDLVEDNLAPVEQAIKRGVIPHAIITPDGQWHEHGKLAWWAIVFTENEDWSAQAKEILSGYPGHQLLILDAHI